MEAEPRGRSDHDGIDRERVAPPDRPAARGTSARGPRTIRCTQGRFTVLVFDQGEPGRSVGEVTGDGFSIELVGGAYDGYTRAGYLEGGNIQVK